MGKNILLLCNEKGPTSKLQGTLRRPEFTAENLL